MKTDYDIIIVGGGIVGLTMACLLGNSQLRVAVLDVQLPPTTWKSNTYDLRVSAITPFSQKIFQAIDAWSAMQAERVSPFHKIHVWDAATDGLLDFDSAEVGATQLGWIIENRVMQKALFNQLDNYSNIEFISGSELKNIQFPLSHSWKGVGEGRVRVSFGGKEISCALLIGSDGAESQVRKLAKIAIKTHSYEHMALVATVRTEKTHEETAWQRFLTTGPLAFLPLSDSNYCSIVWSTSQQHVAELKQLNEKEFCKTLAVNFGYRLGKIETASECATFPLRMRHAKNYVTDNLVLIGDAAHTIHPLAGQGVNMGIADASCLAKNILNAHTKKRDIGSLHTLRPYERERKAENLKMLTVVDALKKLFANQALSIQWIRGLGLKMTNKSGFIKNYLMRSAMGDR